MTRPSLPVTEASQRERNSSLFLGGYWATLSSVSLGKWAAGDASALNYGVLGFSVVFAAALLAVLLRRRRYNRAAEASFPLSLREAEAKREAERHGVAASLWIYLTLCWVWGADAWRLLHNATLGLGYKAFIIVAINLAVCALSQSLPVGVAYYRETHQRLLQTEPSAWRRFILLLMPNAYDPVRGKPAAPSTLAAHTVPVAAVPGTLPATSPPPVILQNNSVNRP